MRIDNTSEYDLVLANGTVVDGVEPTKHADVGIRDGIIQAVGPRGSLIGQRVINCEGLIVAPGFIDAHSHGDLIDLYSEAIHEPLRLASLRQGVTTQVTGNCGFSPFGTYNDGRANANALKAHYEQLMGSRANVYSSAEDYRSSLCQVGLTQNIATLAGHGSLIAALSQKPAPSDSHLRAVRDEIEKLVAWGIHGLSAGLIYSHGSRSTSRELAAVASTLKGANIPMVFHLRGETHNVVDAVSEVLNVTRSAGVPCHISHHKIAGKHNWGRSRDTLRIVDEARKEGQDVTLDVYPYTSSSTSLHALLPHDMVRDGSFNLGRFGNRIELAAKALNDRVMSSERDWENMLGAAGWPNVWIASGIGCEDFIGMSLQDIAAKWAVHPSEATVRLVTMADGPITVVFEALDEGDLQRILLYEGTFVGSDGIPLPGRPHPRWAGTYTRLLERYVRQEKVLSIEEAVYKMSGYAAARFRLEGRGAIRVGNVADLVAFDLDRLEARATPSEPLGAPVGVRTVVLGGVVVIRDSTIEADRRGRFLEPA